MIAVDSSALIATGVRRREGEISVKRLTPAQQ
jgi:hypothetical protein